MNKCLNFNILEILRLKRSNKCRIVTKNKKCCVLACRLYGKSSFSFDEKELTVRKGDILYIPAGASYNQKSDEKEDIVCFHLEIFGTAPEEITVYSPENVDEICGIFKSASEIWMKKEKNFEYSCMSLLYLIISSTGAIIRDISSDKSIIRNGVNYIDTNLYSTDLSIEHACKVSNVSRTYFNRIFLKEYGTTPVKYIQKKRIEKAMLLIGSGDYTREEVATLCGFKDVKYFYIVFKKITGLTTKEYNRCRVSEASDSALS